MSTIKVDTVETTDNTKDMLFKTNSTEAMRIDTDGNVGIGTSSTNAVITLLSGTTNDSSISFSRGPEAVDNNRGRIRYRQATQDMQFRVNNNEVMRINSNGMLLVGAESQPTDTVDGFGVLQSGIITTSVRNDKQAVFNRNGTSGECCLFQKNAVTVGKIQVTGTATSYVTSSDYRLKTDAQPITGASARVQALNPVNFEWIADGSRTDGFLAHEAQAVVPECASGTKDAVDEDGNPDYQGIDQSKLVPLLTAALQEALTRIEALEEKA